MSAMAAEQSRYVSRGGDKLRAALGAFGVDVDGLVCADFGSNVGGFTDCLLQAGAARVFAVDTGYGELAWRLRKDERVVVMERTNALHTPCPVAGGVGLVVIDVAFTPQRLIVPAAGRWLAEGGRTISLLKPHYELAKFPGRPTRRRAERLTDERAREIRDGVCAELNEMGFPVAALADSPLRGKGGNREYLLLLAPAGSR
jgi:23S rRNA (cytidine1920-2'-O)/16S rRNA (cytidine1409-2'-O)-methyltransferase